VVWSHRAPRLVVAVAGALALGVPLAAAGTTAAAAAPAGLTGASSSPATSPGSPVNLKTPVNFGAAIAARGATVTAGDARFQVLGDGLIRMEYSPTRNFEDLPTVNVVNRRFQVPDYRAAVSGGWLTITTSQAVLRYRLGSGPFGPSNVSVRFDDAGRASTASPVWSSECPYGQVCDAGAAALSGPANIQTDHAGYQSVAGFVAGLGQGNAAAANWTVLGAPAGQARVTLRYANYIGALGGPAPRTIDLVVDGTDTGPLTLAPTASWDDWSTVTADVPLTAGTNTVGVLCAGSDSCNVNVDTLSVSAAGAGAPALPDLEYLGGYTRGFDTATYGPGYSCPAGTPTASQCTAALPQMHPGILDRAGYRLLDDTQSAVWTRDGWVAPRPANGDVEDGYLFVYGDDYGQALQDLNQLTGPSPLLDESNFGVWYSDYYPYTTSDYENTLIPAFRANNVPLDDLSVDTDWKSPNQWDGWEWNPALFPDPASFLAWAKSQGIHVTLNVHASIADNDPQLAATQALAGGPLTDSSCFSGACQVWDWSQVAQAESYFALHQPYEAQGVDFWWLDWCCDASTVSMPGLTPDDWINHLYAMDMANKGQRGFVLSRTGSSYQNPDEVYPAGPWSGHTSTLAFTGDTWGTWNTLTFQAQLAADEASIDEPYVSNDIGSFLGPPPGNAQDDSDLYARWVQLGTFQPVLRLHSSAGNRLPWDYPGPAGTDAASFLRLREALVPYTYTLADQSVNTGLPITRPLYLDYPGDAAAYANPGEYLYGPDMLVAPVTTPGNVATERVWFPPGTWTDWFTGATFQGPSTQTLTVPLDRMPVFVKAGGIVPEQAPMDHVGGDPGAPLTLRVYPGQSGSFTLYQDAGGGTGYEKGQYSLTSIDTTQAAGGSAATVDIGPARGSYPGQPGARSFDVDIVGVSRPRTVLLDGRPLAASGWTYDAATHTVTAPVTGLSRGVGAQVTEVGGTAIVQAEPAALDLSVDPATPLSLPAGQSATVTTTERNAGPGDAGGTTVTLSAPSGWTVTPSTAASAGTIAPGSSATQSWTVQAPAGSSTAPVTASLQAQASYTSAGLHEQVEAAEQAPPASAPPPTPVITAVSPSDTAAGTSVTLTGQNFGSSQGASYLTLAQGGTSWGAPYDGAKLTITSWSDTSITFTLPPDSGPFPLVPGPATITVTVDGETSAAQTITVTGTVTPAPVLSSVSPATTTAGSSVTLTGQNFGSSQGSSYLTLAQGGTSWGAPYDGATLTITSWSDTSIVFNLPPDSGSFPLEPGTATITVTVGGQSSAPQTITITS
jgi:alpha-glucosidase (family GH31 glycosyl hydrolase)